MSSNWDDIIIEAEEERFVGRENELELFRKEIKKEPPHFLVFYITGQGGVGKSTLLGQYRTFARDSSFLLADTDEVQRDVPSVLGRFAQQLLEQGTRLKQFEERYKTYRQKMDEIENDPQAPQGLAALLGRTVVRATYMFGDMVPGVRKGLEYLPQEQVETQASQWAEYLTKKLTNKDEIALIRDPNPILTRLFFEDLNEQAQRRRFLLCFENFEETRQELQIWLLRLREYKPSSNIRLAIAGRNVPGAQWDNLRRVTYVVHLDVFTEQEAETFLNVYGIMDTKRREEILAYSNRLPVLMSWLAAPEGENTENALPIHDIVERFLRWITDSALRRVALIGAIPRFFNIDLLACLFTENEQKVDVQKTFEWLQTMPFVHLYTQGWRYHDVVRDMLLRYQRQMSPQSYRHLHTLLAQFYDDRRRSFQNAEEEQWTHELWRKETLSFLYHVLVADPFGQWTHVISILAIAMRKRRSFALEIIEMLDQRDLQEELVQEQLQLIRLVKQQLQAIEQGDLKDGMEMFKTLSQLKDLVPQAKGYLLSYYAECFRQNDQEEKALPIFQEALDYIPQDVWTLAHRGEAYRWLAKYAEALADFDQAIALDEKDGWAIGSRGQTYQQMGKYTEALADFDRAIALDEKYSWVIAQRGQTYRLMSKYTEALADFDRAIALDEKWIILRGETYRLMGKYAEALADYDRAIALDEELDWAIAQRGQTYRLIGKYTEALADFDRAIALNEKYSWAIAQRGQTYRLMGKHAEALADFDRAIALNEKYSWAIAQRGQTYRLMGKYEEALVDYDRAIALDEELDWAFAGRGQTYQLMDKYIEALADYDRAIALNEKHSWAIAQRGETYRLMGKYTEALADFDRAIALNEKYSWAIGSRGQTYQLMGKYTEALADYDRAIALDEELDWAIAQRGQTYRLIGKYTEALADFDRAIALDEELDWAIAQRGQTYRLMGKYTEALADFDRAIALNEKYSWAIAQRGQTYRLMGKHAEALADFDRAIALNEKYSWAIAQRGQTYRLMGKYEEALVDYDRAIALDEKSSWKLAGRGETYRLMGKYEEALADYDRAIALDEKYSWAIGSRGQTYQQMGKYEEALADYDRAIALDEEWDWAIAQRGQTYQQMGKYEEALADYDRAIALDEEDDWDYYLRAQLYHVLGRTQEIASDIHIAIEHAQKAIQTTSDIYEIYRLRFQIALYLFLEDKYDEAEALVHELVSSCTSVEILQVTKYALHELPADYLEQKIVLRIQSLLQTRIDEIRHSSPVDA